MIDEGKILLWEDAQRLMLPPEASMLVPMPPADDFPDLTNAPSSPPDWLTEDDPEAALAAAEREQFGPGPIRLITQVITLNAIGQLGQSLGRNPSANRLEEDEARRRLSDSTSPEKKS